MAHPVKMLEELKENKPSASIAYWVFGIFHSSRSNEVNGYKGLLAASEESLFFKSGGSGKVSYLLETPLREVKKIKAELKGTVSMTIYLMDGGYIEMSYISRGNPKEFIRFLKSHGEISEAELLTFKKPE